MSKFQPQTSKDFIGIPKVFSDLKTAIQKHDKVLLHGPPGVGKTSSTYVIARELGYHVIEINASDERKKAQLKKILARCQQVGLFGSKILFLLDEVDGLHAWKTIETIIKKSIHPVVLTANEGWKIPDRIKHYCTIIKYPQPLLQDVVKHLRKHNKDQNADYSGVSRDVRASINNVLYGGDKYNVEDDFHIVGQFFKEGKVKDLNSFHIPYLIDNAPQHYHGRTLYDFYVLLELATRTSLQLLQHFPHGKGKGVQYPYYLKRLKFLKKRTKKESNIKIPARIDHELI